MATELVALAQPLQRFLETAVSTGPIHGPAATLRNSEPLVAALRNQKTGIEPGRAGRRLYGRGGNQGSADVYHREPGRILPALAGSL